MVSLGDSRSLKTADRSLSDTTVQKAVQSGSDWMAREQKIRPANATMTMAEALTFKNPLSALQLLPIKDLEKIYTTVVHQALTSLVLDKIEKAGRAAENNVALGIDLLVSALDDIDWARKRLKHDLAGRKESPRLREEMAWLKLLEDLVFGRIREVLGVNLTNAQLRALLQKTASQRAQSNRGAQFEQLRNAPALKGLVQRHALRQDTLSQSKSFGMEDLALQSKSRERLSQEAVAKLTHEAERFLKQAAQLLQQARQNPARADWAGIRTLLGKVEGIVLLLDKGDDTASRLKSLQQELALIKTT